MNINVVPERDSQGNVINRLAPFGSSEMGGLKLYKRIHGVVVPCVAGVNNFDLVIPYNTAKLNSLEIVWQPQGCTASFKVYDTPAGTISGTPNLMLNQYGFDVGIAKDKHVEASEYEADTIKDMKLSCEITCPTGFSGDICVNFILNETK